MPSTVSDIPEIPRARFGLLMLPAVLVAGALSAGMALALGGTGREVSAALIAVGVGSILTFAPALLQLGRENWGVAVLAFGLFRSLVILGAAWMIESANPELAKRPFYLAVMGGAVFLLVVETAVAVTILQKIENARLALKKSKNTSRDGEAKADVAPVEHA